MAGIGGVASILTYVSQRELVAEPIQSSGGPVTPTSGVHVLTTVLCGSYRRDPAGLRSVFARLRDRYDVLSPSGLDFVNPDQEFVRLAHESEDSVQAIEQRHLQAITSADFVWLHAPGGYIGSSAALEIGHAQALGIPVFSETVPSDVTLATMVRVVPGPEAVGQALTVLPGQGLQALQLYYGRAAARRGWDTESAQDTLLLLTEELGELARAVRKTSGIARDGEWGTRPIGAEIADVQLYLVHLANVLGVDLAVAVSDKERVNAERVASRTTAA